MTEATSRYTFGDGRRASERLRRLAELYEPETRALLAEAEKAQGLAIDLGCGPGCSTELLHAVAQPQATVGLDAAPAFVAEASARAPRGVQYLVHDITQAPFPCAAADILFCRFLLTHLASPERALSVWAAAARPGARLYIHETADLASDHPAIALYYSWVEEMQAHYGQSLYVGADIDDRFDARLWRIVRSERIEVRKPARRMAELHLMNLRTWRNDPFVRRRHAPQTLTFLERDLERIAAGEETADDVRNDYRHVVAVRR